MVCSSYHTSYFFIIFLHSMFLYCICFQELLIRLTDSKDPFMLYTCVVREDDYHTLRQHQELLVDFHTFPQTFVELVKSCSKESDMGSPK